MTKRIDCEFCGAPNAMYVIKTGVSAHFACLRCFGDWNMSDQTSEALKDLKARRPA